MTKVANNNTVNGNSSTPPISQYIKELSLGAVEEHRLPITLSSHWVLPCEASTYNPKKT